MQTGHKPVALETEIERIIQTKQQYFWDKGPMHPQQDGYIIIERVLEFGTEDEVATVLKYYGSKSVKKVVKESSSISKRTVNYFAMLLDISRKETRCFSDVSHRIWQPY
ncbi:MAG: hypothetical protein U9P49_02455 [Thermodesulfobacteriota bacterium]|nr:hypothetical protein [Thermodesulfobacteriota bacterium]